jgi:hypothetical protein
LEQLNLNEIFEIWGVNSDSRILETNSKLDLSYNFLSKEEFESSILRVLQVLDTDLSKAGPHRLNDWEKGWGENLKKFNENEHREATLPGYFEKSKIIRWKQKWIKPRDAGLEQKLLSCLVDSLTLKFGSYAESIYEFGCGTGHHLFRLRELFPKQKLIGLDWAKSSQELITKYADSRKDLQLHGEHFDFFNPNLDLVIKENSLFLTVASLEQTFDGYMKFVDFMLKSKPMLVINIEPMAEFLDPGNLLDLLSLKYFTKRNYLNNYFNYLKLLEEKGKISILDSRRTYLGSFFIDGYSIVVWKPN